MDRLCKNSLTYSLFLKSANGKFKKRRIVRDTWGNDAAKRGYRQVFLLGYNKNDDIFVNFEKKQYLTISFKIKIQDTYENQNQNGIALDIKILKLSKIHCSRRR